MIGSPHLISSSRVVGVTERFGAVCAQHISELVGKLRPEVRREPGDEIPDMLACAKVAEDMVAMQMMAITH